MFQPKMFCTFNHYSIIIISIIITHARLNIGACVLFSSTPTQFCADKIVLLARTPTGALCRSNFGGIAVTSDKL